MLIKAADVSNPAKEFDIYIQWTNRVLEEWRIQGDNEKRLNIPVSPFMDRDNPNVLISSQTGFIEFIVSPLFEAIHTGFMKLNKLIEEIEKNRSHWNKMKEEIPMEPSTLRRNVVVSKIFNETENKSLEHKSSEEK